MSRTKAPATKPAKKSTRHEIAFAEVKHAHAAAPARASARSANATPHYCSLRPAPVRELSPGISRSRLEAIQPLSSYWVNGTVITYAFYREGAGHDVLLSDGSSVFMPWTSDDAQKTVCAAWKTWKDLGLGLEFKEVSNPDAAMVRIAFEQSDGAWSYVGRDVLGDHGADKRTMNFGWNLVNSSDGVDTALHEIGHTLGFSHEHQNPNAGIVWNEQAVYDALAKPPNSWPRETTYHNIIRKIAPDTIRGSTWDADSIMHYPFEPGLIREPARFAGGLSPAGGISALDREYALRYYPKLRAGDYETLKPFESVRLSLAAGQQANFYIKPERSRTHTLQTIGTADTLLVLFEEESGRDPRFLAGDDDSGHDRNASIRIRLLEGRRYIARLRLYYADVPGETAIMVS